MTISAEDLAQYVYIILRERANREHDKKSFCIKVGSFLPSFQTFQNCVVQSFYVKEIGVRNTPYGTSKTTLGKTEEHVTKASMSRPASDFIISMCSKSNNICVNMLHDFEMKSQCCPSMAICPEEGGYLPVWC